MARSRAYERWYLLKRKRARLASTANITWATAFAAPTAVLRTWFDNNTGPRVPITNFVTGNVTVASQAEADALAGTQVTGTITVNAAVTLQNFRVRASADDSNTAQSLVLVNGSGSNSTIRYFHLDGRRGIGTYGINGTGATQNCLVQYGEIEWCGQDPIRGCRNCTYEYMYVHNVAGWNASIHGAFDYDTMVHTDGMQTTRDGVVVRRCWIENGVDVNNTSGIILNSVEIINSYVVEYCYLDGGGHVMHAYPDISLVDPGPNWWPHATYRYNRIGRAHKNTGGSEPWAIAGVPSEYMVTTGNIWTDTLLPVPSPAHVPTPFVPSSLGSACYAWWDAEWLPSLTLSAGAVSAWASRVGSAQSFVQATSTRRPLFDATGHNGRPAVVFDGVDDYLELASHSLPSGSTACEIWMVLDQRTLASVTGSVDIFDYGGGATVSRRVRRAVASGVNRLALQNGTGSATTSLTISAGDFSGRHVVRVQFTGTNLVGQVDNLATNTVASIPGTASAARARIGATDSSTTPTAGTYSNVAISSIVVTAPLDSTQAANMLTYLSRRTGGTVL